MVMAMEMEMEMEMEMGLIVREYFITGIAIWL